MAMHGAVKEMYMEPVLCNYNTTVISLIIV